ncbi:MAG: DUF2807 domain-containing protein [Dysgonamonadaceae bacterium]|jgi:hypothetical protein|nr:DUF2807 domain-containing protein [Dysgonamonadaceae bacterium]
MKIKKHLINILSMTFIFTTHSCMISDTVRGNRNIISEEINVSDYTKIYFSVPGDLVYRQTQDKAPYLKITADENILPLLEIKATGNSLEIKCRDNTNISPSRLTVHTGSTRMSEAKIAGSGEIHLKDEVKSDDMGIYITGSGTVMSDALSCEKMQISISGSGEITLKGTGGEASCSISGSGDIDASAFPVQDMDCRISGSGDALVCVKNKLTARVTGSGNIQYTGNPSETDTRVTGSGDIRKKK